MTLRQVILLFSFCVGFLVGQATFSHEVVRVGMVGLGFVAASVLPTITLLVNGLTSTGRSVKAINELHRELTETVRRLFAVLALALASVVLLLPMPTEMALPSLELGKYFLIDPIGKLMSGLATCTLVGLIFALKEVPSAIFRSLELRRSIAVDEARQRNADRVAQVEATSVFPTKEGFGEKVSLRVSA